MSYFFLTILFIAELVKEGIFFGKRKRIPVVQMGFITAEILFFLLLVIFGGLPLDTAWLFPGIYLVCGLISAYFFFSEGKKKDCKIRKAAKYHPSALPVHLLLLFLCMIPALLFPPVIPLPVTGGYAYETVSFTWTDDAREEEFCSDGSSRRVAVQFWYPVSGEGETFPLIVFSHGAFGYRMSNYSAYTELASNGYVVCSVEHPYHAIFSELDDGEVIIVDKQFMSDISRINGDGMPEEEIFRVTRPWLQLRTDDLNFVMDEITRLCGEEGASLPFSITDPDNIGLFGHSLGGAAAVTAGRERPQVRAVIDLDGTMLGEETGFADGKYQMNTEPYPVPLLCIDTSEHYEQGQKYGDQYVNHVILSLAKDGREIQFTDAGHMNFTDLPLFSLPLAALLGTGTRDAGECLVTMNGIISDYFDYYLKGQGTLSLQETY